MVISTARYWQKTISDFNKNCGPDSTRFGPLRSIFRVNIRSSPAIFPHLPDLGLNRPFEGGIWPFQRPGTRKTPFSTSTNITGPIPADLARPDRFSGPKYVQGPILGKYPPSQFHAQNQFHKSGNKTLFFEQNQKKIIKETM